MPEKAWRFLEILIREKRQALGRAEQKPNVKAEELRSLGESIEVLEWISQLVLGAKEG